MEKGVIQEEEDILEDGLGGDSYRTLDESPVTYRLSCCKS
jgi:hypothetical protein